MAELTSQPSINDTRGRTLLGLIERLGQIDLTPLLVYRIDSVPDSALLFLAWQFDVMPPWTLAAPPSGESIDTLLGIDELSDIDTLNSPDDIAGVSDYDSWRQLIKVAVALHAMRGTPYAIKTALKNYGFPNVTIHEGQASWGGTSYPPNQGWALFRVTIALSRGEQVPASDIANALSIIKLMKPARSWLDSLWFAASALSDHLAPAPSDRVSSAYQHFNALIPAPTDQVSAAGWALADSKTIMPSYNRRFDHAGITYGAGEPTVADGPIIVDGAAVE